MSTAHHGGAQDPKGEDRLNNRPAPNTSYYTPLQSPPAGTAIVPKDKSAKDIPKVFQPLRIRGMLMQNRIMLSPMCQYSAEDGHATDWHMAHLGGIISRGPGLACVEATAVTANGRITPQDMGLWKDSQIAPLARVVEFAHSQNQKIMIQLGHAGRKASTVAPWLSSASLASDKLGGWAGDVVGPSAIAWDSRHADPKEMSTSDIQAFKQSFLASVRRALKAGFDAIEIHAAHGYLLSSFLAEPSNTRTDNYGGSFDNRVRLLLETARETRAVIPDSMPLFVRVNGSDNHKGGWTDEDTARLAPLLVDAGVDALDVSSGGNHPDQAVDDDGPAYQAPFAYPAKKAVGEKLLVGTVGNISSGKVAEEQLDSKGLDFVVVGTGFLKDPSLVWTWAEQLGVHVRLPNQIRWGFEGRGHGDGQPITDLV
ncbi:hypothetical protein ANO11243_073930 [Dothideomycetidae sp. 11243]|nr:hypothetical protein ANO11243_073930 [fungal sp. No.11243]